MKNHLTAATIALFVMLLSFTSCQAQNKDSILNKHIGRLDLQAIQTLTAKGLLRQDDLPLLGTYLLKTPGHGATDSSMTYGQLLDSFSDFKKAWLMSAGEQKIFGKDSVFIRTPGGDKAFLGMGEMSLEKIIARESANLPKGYEGDNNLKVDGSITSSNAIATLSAPYENIAWAIGNVVLVKRDSGELSSLRIGDIFEIAGRVAHSKEMAPFINRLK